MALSPPVPLPPACAECTTTLQPAQPGSPSQKIAYKLSRAGDGKMRIDYGTTSVITNPATQQMTVLDHVKKEVRTIPLPKGALPQVAPPQLQPVGLPGAPTPPAAPAMTVKDLGKRLVAGHEVEGKQYTLPPLTPPKPQAQMPAAPNQPQLPPKPEPQALVSEVWMSTQLHLPLLTRITGSFGQQMCHCKNTVAGEPHPSLFQVPPDYKQVAAPAAPKPPSAG